MSSSRIVSSFTFRTEARSYALQEWGASAQSDNHLKNLLRLGLMQFQLAEGEATWLLQVLNDWDLSKTGPIFYRFVEPENLDGIFEDYLQLELQYGYIPPDDEELEEDAEAEWDAAMDVQYAYYHSITAKHATCGPEGRFALASVMEWVLTVGKNSAERLSLLTAVGIVSTRKA